MSVPAPFSAFPALFVVALVLDRFAGLLVVVLAFFLVLTIVTVVGASLSSPAYLLRLF